MLGRLRCFCALFIGFSIFASATELAGKWSGTFEELAPDGSVRRSGGAYMDLKISGESVTGTAGPSETEQVQITNGRVEEGKRLTFELLQPQGPTMKFDLVFDGQLMKGSVAAAAGNQHLAARVSLKPMETDRAADREAIRTHIERIFQAFIHKNAADLRATHAANWLGYLEGSPTVIRGIEGYMEWSFDPGSPYGMTGYKIREFDMIFDGDAAFVTFIAEVESNTPNGPSRRTLRIADFYTKQSGAWIQSGSDTDLHPESVEQRMHASRPLSQGEKVNLLAAREAVWRAFFDGDRASLERLLPSELLAIDASEEWQNRQAVLNASAQFAAGGGKLLRLEFPRTEIQAYGATAIVYSSYVYEIEEGGRRSTRSGRVTEVFVRRGNGWVNPSWHMDLGR